MIMPANKTAKQAQSIQWMFKTATGIDLRSFLDISTINWGKPEEKKKKTTFSFWICSDVIEYGLQALRNNTKIQSYLRYGNCVMNSTNLRESKSKIIAYLQGKDPRHTHRMTMSERITYQVLAPLQNTVPIACNIVNTTIKGYQILAIAVGSRDANSVEKYLEEHLDEDLTMILHKWKRTNPGDFEKKLKEHQLIVTNSKAYKIQNMDPTATPSMLHNLRATPAGPMVVDVSTTGHSESTGTVYVQFLKGSEAAVLSAVNIFLDSYQKPEDSPFYRPPKVVNGNQPDSPTVQSRDTVGFTPEPQPLPKSKWTEILANERINNNLDEAPPPRDDPVPRNVTMPKSFSAALMGGHTPSAQSDNDNSTITEQTSNARSSRKSNRERALEEENTSLKTQIAALTTSFNNRITELQSEYKQEISDLNSEYRQEIRDLTSEYKQEITDLNSKLEQILLQTAQKDSPNRKKQDTKASPTKFSYPRPSSRSATRPGT